MNLNSLALLLQIVDAGSLAAAAKETGLSTVAISDRLSVLEDQFGVTLLTRSTRSLSLTTEGEVLVEGARRLVSDAEKLETAVRNGGESDAQIIRFSAPTDLGENVIMPIVETFLVAHPLVTIDVVISDENVDILREGMDFAIRDGGASHDALISEHLLDNRRVVVAAPSYLERKGRPDHPSDLIDHDCLTLRVGRHINRFWKFTDGAALIDAPIMPTRMSNNTRLILEWCRQGRGLAVKSHANVVKDLNSGALVEVLDGYPPPPSSFYLIHPSDRSFSPAVSKLAADISHTMKMAEQVLAA